MRPGISKKGPGFHGCALSAAAGDSRPRTRSTSSMSITAKIDGKNLVVTIPMQDPTPSATGKTMVVATSRGNAPTEAKVGGKTVIVGLNAYIKP
jgi:hypothetical protein